MFLGIDVFVVIFVLLVVLIIFAGVKMVTQGTLYPGLNL